MPIPCSIVDDAANATEISLAENTIREQMHPADEVEAYQALIEDGQHPADIAARFGVNETYVNQSLKLARVSPVIMKAYRKGGLSLAHVKAFAVSDDHAAQERVWENLSDWQLEDPATIRDALTDDEITASDRRVKFVTLKAYEKAGGAVRRDLFATDEDGLFIQDIALLETLVAKKLEKAAATVRKEGWKWVEIRPAFDYSEWSKYGRRYPEAEPLSDEQQQELEALLAEHEKLGDSEDGDEFQRYDEIERQIAVLEDREKTWPPEAFTIAGAIVSIGHDGKPEINRGFVKPEDTPKNTSKITHVKADGTVTVTELPGSGLSSSLIESLTAERSAALAASLKDNPRIALAAVVHAFVLGCFYQGCSRNTALQITASAVSLHRVQEAAAFAALERTRQHWGEQLPVETDGLWAWCLKQQQDTLLDLLAFCAASTVNAVQTKGDRHAERLVHANNLAASLQLDMAVWYKPRAANYFSRIGKTAIIEALCEIKGGGVAPAWEKMKKNELASLAERHTADTTWLPAAVAPKAAEAEALKEAA